MLSGMEVWLLLAFVLGVVSFYSVFFWLNLSSQRNEIVWFSFFHECYVIFLGFYLLYAASLAYKTHLFNPGFWGIVAFILILGNFAPRFYFFSIVPSLEKLKNPVEEDRSRLKEGVLEFCNESVKDAMVPINDVFKVPSDISFEELLELSDFKSYSRIPVYRDEKDNLIGILYAKDVIHESSSKDNEELLKETVKRFIRHAYYVPEVMEQADLLKEFQKRRIQIAIVVDEYGVTTGIVTLEDLLETIIGEIQDQSNDDEHFVEQIGLREWALDARLDLDDFSELVGKNFESDTVDTLGGFVFQEFGALPDVGQILNYKGLEFEVTEMEGYRLRNIKVRELE
jgi:CBS domain containing-hemolysin-like protein